MSVRLLNLALLAALAVAGLRLWQFLGEAPPTLPPLAPAAATSASLPTSEGSQDPKGEAAEPRPEAYDVIVARDLFSATRGVVIAAPAVAAAAKPAPKPQPPPKLTLFGVVILDGERTAYLQEGPQEARPRKVRENEAFAGGVVKAIRADGVSFLFAGREINIPLRTPKEGASSPAAHVQEPVNPVQNVQESGPFRRGQAQPGALPGQMAVPGSAPAIYPGMPMSELPQPLPNSDGGEEEEGPRGTMPEGPAPGADDEGQE